jgi:uncharacterized protein DUF4328
MDRYEHLTNRCKPLLIALGVVIVLDVANALSGVAEVRLLGRLIDGEVLSPASLEASDSRVVLLGFLQGVAYLVAAVLFIRWFHRAYRNLDVLGSQRRHGTGWAIGGWFVPILALFRPKQIMNDIWRGTKPAPGAGGAEPMLMVWWLGFLLSAAVTNFAFRIAFTENETAEQLRRSGTAYIASDLLDAAVAILAIIVVRRTTDRMEAYARNRAVAPPPPTSFAPPLAPAT